MIQPDLLGRLRLLAEAYRIPLQSVTERVNEPLPVGPVRPVEAEVEARLPDGRFRVFAAGQRFEVALPQSTRPGDRVQVTAPSAQGNAAPQPSEGAPDAVAARLSAAGRFLAQFADGGAGGRAPGAIPASQPLLPDQPVNAQVAAATLRELVALSGLFYESHQAEWVNNTRATAQLLLEPQARHSPGFADPRAAAPAAAATHGQAAAEPAAPGAPQGAERTAAPQQPIHPDTAPIVQQQLNALEARHIVWTGQIWPGQPMHWEIEERAERDPDAPPDEPRRLWHTRITLDLPRLGRVEAHIALGAPGLAIRLAAEQPATDALFAQRLAELTAALAAAGLPPATISRNAHGLP